MPGQLVGEPYQRFNRFLFVELESDHFRRIFRPAAADSPLKGTPGKTI